jgi:hypothetical protein
MTRWRGTVVALVVLATAPPTASSARQKGGSQALTEADRVQIKELSIAYGRALGMCLAEEYAGLYAAPDGYFASGPRGRVVGPERLRALLQSEPFCHDGSPKAPRNLPSTFAIEPSAEGAKARVALATTPGHYEDTYVKTARGWRFKGRTYISTSEAAAGLTAADFDEIRRIGGNDTAQFQDVWLAFPEGKRFRSSGLVIAPAKEGGATGRGVLADGGRYDDVYVKTPKGWRFTSRQYTPVAESGGKTAAAK